jgi:hypothetical protein
MHQRIWLSSCLVPCLVLLFSQVVNAKDLDKEASKLFEKRFKEGQIKGTGHLFWIVADCDNKRLKSISDKLPENKAKVIEYELMLEVNTVQKSKARVVGGGLGPSVERCIVDKFYSGIAFSPSAEPEIEYRIKFPAILMKGWEPRTPTTPIGVVGPTSDGPTTPSTGRAKAARR